MAIFGEIERAVGELYALRVPISAGLVLLAVVAGSVAVRRGWLRAAVRLVRARPLPAAAAVVLVLAVSLALGDYLLSPLWERSTLIEEAPATLTAASSDQVSGPAAARESTARASARSIASPSESEGAAPSATAVGPRQGEFRGADDFHFARGRALLVQSATGDFVLRLEDFSVRNGPDLYVYLSNTGEQPDAEAIRLGRLKATDGAFNYELPPGVDAGSLDYVLIWCDAFSVLFGSAELTAP